jgi:hypothetical protein
MSLLSITIGDYVQLSHTFEKDGLPVNLGGVEQIAYTLLYPSGAPFVQWLMTAGQIAVDSPPTSGLATTTVTPEMLPASLWPLGIPAETTLIGVASLIDAFGNPTLRSGVDSVQLKLPPTPPVVV